MTRAHHKSESLKRVLCILFLLQCGARCFFYDSCDIVSTGEEIHILATVCFRYVDAILNDNKILQNF